MHDVFISYSRRESKEFVERLARALEEAGKNVWVDLDDIPPASRWEEDLREGVDNSDALLFVISPAAVASDYCRGELEHAAEHNKRVIPVTHRAVLPDELPAEVAARNWIPPEGSFDDAFDASLATLIAAIEVDADRIRAHGRWERRADQWNEKGRPSSLLARGSDLRDAEAWMAEHAGREPQTTRLQTEFIAASRRGHSRRLRLALGAALGALALTAAFGVYALIQRNEAIDQRDFARSNELASAAIASLETDPELALILALEGAETRFTGRTEQALSQALAASRVRATVEPPGGLATSRLSPNGRWVVTATSEGAQLYDARSGELVRAFEPGGKLVDAFFTSDSSRVIAAGVDGVVRGWGLDGDASVLARAQGWVGAAALSPDDGTLALGNEGGDIELIALDGGRDRTLAGHRDDINSLDFAAGGEAIVSTSGDGTAGIWDIRRGRPVAGLAEQTTPVDAAITPGAGKAVVVAGGSATRIWDVSKAKPIGEPLTTLTEDGGAWSVDLSRDGTLALIALLDGTVELFDLRSRELLATYRSRAGSVRPRAEFGADDAMFAAAAPEGVAKVWDVDSRQAYLEGSEGTFAVAFSGDGRLIAGALVDGTVGLWDPRTGHRRGTFGASPGPLWSIAVSPDGTRVATGSADGDALGLPQAGPGTAAVWRLGGESEAEPLVLDETVTSVAFDSAGTRLATASTDGKVRVWDTGSGEATTVYVAADGDPSDASFSPDGERVLIAAAPDDTTSGDAFRALLADAETGDEVEEFELERYVTSVALDPAGERVAGAGDGGTGRVWDAATGEPLADLTDQRAEVNTVRWSPSGEQVITAAADVRIFGPESGLELARIPSAATDIAISSLGSIAVVPAEGPVAIHECEVCAGSRTELLALAESQITREPTPEEIALHGLD